jgi:hypothetical protein
LDYFGRRRFQRQNLIRDLTDPVATRERFG